jgi:aminoglycoside phosphotransferase (APT) family kinase protein
MEPRSTQNVPTSLLYESLEKVLSDYFGKKRRIQQLRRRSSAYSSSYALENLEVELDRGEHLRLVFKNLSPESVLKTARAVRPGFVYHPEREIEIYHHILDAEKLGTPICYGAVEVPELERYWLFLERVEGPLLWQRGRLQSWERAAEWLAMLHTQYRVKRRNENTPWLKYLARYDEHMLTTWLLRAEEFLRRDGDNSPEVWRRFARLANRYDEVIARVLDLPMSLIHGEFFPSNVILRTGPYGQEICPVDWEMAAIGPGLIDLAALTAGNWTLEQKRKMVTAYGEGLRVAHGWRPSTADLVEAVTYCQLHLSVQLLGWASHWSPPKRHTQNWLGEALRLSGALGL